MILDRTVVRITAVSIPCRLEIAEIMFLAMPAIMRAIAGRRLVTISRFLDRKAMARSSSKFTQADVTRAVKGAMAAGVQVAGVEVDANGRIRVIAGDPAIMPTGVNDRDDQADLDRELAEFERARDSTKRNWSRWLDQIAEYFGELGVVQFDRPEKIRPVIRRWRNQWADKPRTADYAMQVLSRVLSHAVDPLGRIASNPCEGIKQLYRGDRSEIIWTDADIAHIKQTCAIEIVRAVDMAAHTGLRLGDLLRVSWSHVGADAITLTTGKSRHRREVIIPLHDALRRVLDAISKQSTAILTNSRRRPWTENSFGSAFNRAKIDAGMEDRDLHFHDLRGTAATRFYTAGLSVRVIAEVMGWEEEYVEKILRRYVGRNAATKATIAQLNRAGRDEG